ncbi:MAG: 1-acyl-sn-glycerol-3-phosphate acyltransferase [Tannerellaceae bacterium]|jgi:putative hemolysin|nr:1-acyl-sn-glycerol-3-phosphate acyltransferase [Tannerellaceae bacterium]
MEKEGKSQFIDVRQVLREKAPLLSKRLPKFVVDYLVRIVHQDEVNYVISRYEEKEGVDFMVELLDYFDLTLVPHGEENIPPKGRNLFVSNHPLGGMDGICLSAFLGQRFDRKIRYLVNDILLSIPNLRSIFVPINKHGKQARQTALLTDEAYASDHQIITFPAGLCSRRIKGEITDLEWKKSFVQKAVDYHRDVVPVYYDGKNSDFFYRLANIRTSLGVKVNLEMLYLSDELFKSKHSTYPIYFGKPIPWQTFDHSKRPAEWAQWVRNVAYNLKK